MTKSLTRGLLARELSCSEPAERQLYHDNFNLAYYERADRRMAQFQITTGNGLPTNKRTSCPPYRTSCAQYPTSLVSAFLASYACKMLQHAERQNRRPHAVVERNLAQAEG